jgi:lysozyme family protein
MIIKWNEFLAEELLLSIQGDIYKILESNETPPNDRYFEWDIETGSDKIDPGTNFSFDKVKKLVSILPKEKIREYYVRLINGLEKLPDRLRKFLIRHYTSIFLGVASLTYLLSTPDDTVTTGQTKTETIKPKLLKEIEVVDKKSEFLKSQKLVKTAEAGYSDDRGDRGNFYRGRFIGTNHGISAPVLAEYMGKTPTRDDMKNLSYETALEIFKTNYWDAQNLSEFSNQLVANIIYDGCVNQGVSKMKEVVFDAAAELGVELKGQTFTVVNIDKLNSLDQKELFDTIKKYRELRYKQAPTWKRHGTGWMNRLTSFKYRANNESHKGSEGGNLIKENLENDIEFYFNHLKDDDFSIQSETDYIRIFKPTKFNGLRPVYSYSSCIPFQWKEVSGDLDRFISEIGEENISYISGVRNKFNRTGGFERFQISEEQVSNQEFDCGEIISVTVGFIDEL